MRPTMWTSATRLAASAVSAGCGMSVGLSSLAPRASIRATSTATLPTPMTTADRAPTTKPSAAESGCALYQDTNSVADQLPGSSSPGIPRCRSVAAPTQYTTAWYSSRNRAAGTPPGPIPTPPRNRTRSCSRIVRRVVWSDLIFSWSGATP